MLIVFDVVWAVAMSPSLRDRGRWRRLWTSAAPIAPGNPLVRTRAGAKTRDLTGESPGATKPPMRQVQVRASPDTRSGACELTPIGTPGTLPRRWRHERS